MCTLGVMMPASRALGVQLGRFIELSHYDALSKQAWVALASADHKQLFAAAWNGLGYRGRSAQWHVRNLKAALRSEPAATPDTRARQERDIFGLVLNVAAAAECVAFAAFVVFLSLDGRALSDKILRPRFDDMLGSIESHVRTEPVGVFVRAAFDDEAASTLNDVRDVFVHRGVLLRSHWAGGPHDGRVTVARHPKRVPGDWQPDMTLDAGLIDDWCEWFEAYVDGAMPLLHNAMV